MGTCLGFTGALKRRVPHGTMEFLALVKKRRSVRKYSGRPVPREAVERCLEAARLAPSACNCQPWTFIVVDDRKLRDEVAGKAWTFVERESGWRERWEELRAGARFTVPVTGVEGEGKKAVARLDLGSREAELRLAQVKWARPFSPVKRTPAPKSVAEILEPGDLVEIEIERSDERGVKVALSQPPLVQGALVQRRGCVAVEQVQEMPGDGVVVGLHLDAPAVVGVVVPVQQHRAEARHHRAADLQGRIFPLSARQRVGCHNHRCCYGGSQFRTPLSWPERRIRKGSISRRLRREKN